MADILPKQPSLGSAKGWIAGAILVIAVTGLVNSFLAPTNPVRRFMRGEMAATK